MVNKNEDIVIFGSGGFAKEVHQLIEDINTQQKTWNFLGFLDGNEENHGKIVQENPILGGVDWIIENPNVKVVIAIGNPVNKIRVVSELKRNLNNIKFATLIHPQAIVGSRNRIGEGSIICAATIVTTNVDIGDHVILNLDCTVGHDAIIKDYCTVAPSVNISGNVHVGEGSDLGTGSVIIQGLNVGEWSIIGGGAVVIKDINANTTSVGNPSKVIKERTMNWQLQ